MIRSYFIGLKITSKMAGVAIKSVHDNTLEAVYTLSIYNALKLIESYANKFPVKVFIEDNRKSNVYSAKSSAESTSKLRIYHKITIEELKEFRIDIHYIKPKRDKWTAEDLIENARYAHRTSQQGRDAAQIVHGLKKNLTRHAVL